MAFGLPETAESEVGRADRGKDVDVYAALGRRPEIGAEREFVFAGRHEPVADEKPVDRILSRPDTGRGVGAIA